MELELRRCLRNTWYSLPRMNLEFSTWRQSHHQGQTQERLSSGNIPKNICDNQARPINDLEVWARSAVKGHGVWWVMQGLRRATKRIPQFWKVECILRGVEGHGPSPALSISNLLAQHCQQPTLRSFLNRNLKSSATPTPAARCTHPVLNTSIPMVDMRLSTLCGDCVELRRWSLSCGRGCRDIWRRVEMEGFWDWFEFEVEGGTIWHERRRRVCQGCAAERGGSLQRPTVQAYLQGQPCGLKWLGWCLREMAGYDVGSKPCCEVFYALRRSFLGVWGVDVWHVG